MPHRLLNPAKRLRTNSTDAERLLWSRLRAHRLQGFKFKRQQPLGNYVVDFVCFEAHLVIELDGGQHLLAKEEDKARDAWLASMGFRVLRFWNNEVLENLEGVLTRIAGFLSPSP
jgi:very-short-patch-repair endonuclease